MKVDVLLGLQWGDEGKGKVVDVVTPTYDVIARFQGGPNAGHSLEFNGMKHVLHMIPSGIFHPDKMNIIGNGLVIDPITFKKEIDALEKLGVNPIKTLLISKKAHLILPTHRILDAASEASKGLTKIGSTLRGIGPTYMDKTGRNGLRIGDIISPDFKTKYNNLVAKHQHLLKQSDFTYTLADYEKGWMEGIECIRKFQLVDSEFIINEYLKEGKKVLGEGAQGTLLDIDFGSYPFVTSSNTITAGACTGLGIAPGKIGEVMGIMKAYCTRVGSGPFPTELSDETGNKLREIGKEFGATTGRPRRCGWLDLVALNYANILNGTTQLVMTKIDVLSAFDSIKVCTAYEINGKKTTQFPYELTDSLKPIYKEFKGWKKDITKITKASDLPSEILDYVSFIENELRVPITMISVGPDRNEIILK